MIVQDAELELHPNEYRQLLQPIAEGRANVVYGTRFGGPNRIPWRTQIANRLLVVVMNMLYGSALTDMETAYKVFRSDVIRRVRLQSLRFDIEAEVTSKMLRAGI